jgi:CHAD domain-containing protein
MAFCFKRKKSVAKAIRRLGRERIESALESLKDWHCAEAIHDARKDIKKVRAVLRLVRTRISKKACGRATRLLREAAKRLAAPRDASVKVKTLGYLTHHFSDQLPPGAVRHVRAALRRAAVEETERFAKEETVRTVERILRRVAKQLDRLNVSGKGWKALGPGVRTAYSQGRRAYQVALKHPSPENFHDWRKRAKDFWYQVTLLRPIRPEQLDAMASELEALGEYLGDDHDLVMLREAVEAQCAGNGDAGELKTLNELIKDRRRELRTAFLELGARFYAEKPAVFCERLAGYWQTWRNE